MSRRTVLVSLVVVLLVGVAIGLRAIPTVLPGASPAPAAQAQASDVATPTEPSPTPQWGGPLPNGAPGPGASPCIEVNPGDCGVVTDYDGGLVPYKPSPRR